VTGCSTSWWKRRKAKPRAKEKGGDKTNQNLDVWNKTKEKTTAKKRGNGEKRQKE